MFVIMVVSGTSIDRQTNMSIIISFKKIACFSIAQINELSLLMILQGGRWSVSSLPTPGEDPSKIEAWMQGRWIPAPEVRKGWKDAHKEGRSGASQGCFGRGQITHEGENAGETQWVRGSWMDSTFTVIMMMVFLLDVLNFGEELVYV